MGKIRVLVVEDSVTVRKRLLEILAGDPEIEPIGEAEDGKQAVEICQRVRPDVVSMDMMLPVMSGLSATEYIMAHCPTPILVVSSSVNRAELFRTYEALAAGAVDVLEKPDGTAREGEWEKKYLSLIKLVSRIRVITHLRARMGGLSRHPAGLAPAVSDPVKDVHGCALVAVGASTGGPAAIVEILRSLPPSFQLPILFVLHINEPFGSAFADWLDGQTDRRVAFAKDGAAITGAIGRVIMAPPGQHLVVRQGRFRLTDDPERHSCRPSVDELFESVAREFGPSATACLLTGMGRDGAHGLLKVRQAGGLTIAQDEATSVVHGMPREAILLGAASRVLSLSDIGRQIALLRPAEIAAKR
jgi:two-component system, chemotaxis family, protein-glutamate methylesterase/glutaminase